MSSCLWLRLVRVYSIFTHCLLIDMIVNTLMRECCIFKHVLVLFNSVIRGWKIFSNRIIMNLFSFQTIFFTTLFYTTRASDEKTNVTAHEVAANCPSGQPYAKWRYQFTRVIFLNHFVNSWLLKIDLQFCRSAGECTNYECPTPFVCSAFVGASTMCCLAMCPPGPTESRWHERKEYAALKAC
jgi:hypothetical protein